MVMMYIQYIKLCLTLNFNITSLRCSSERFIDYRLLCRYVGGLRSVNVITDVEKKDFFFHFWK